MKEMNFKCLVVCSLLMLLSVAFAGCAKDEPDVIKPGDDTEEPSAVTMDLIKETLPGSWVAFDSQNVWNRLTVSFKENGESDFVWLESKDQEMNGRIDDSIGKVGITDTNGCTAELTIDGSTTMINWIGVTPIRLSGMEMTCDVRKRSKEFNGTILESDVVFHRVLDSVFGKLDEKFTISLDPYVNKADVLSVTSMNPRIATIDLESNTVTINGYGTTYIEVKTEEGTAYIEATGSPLVSLPELYLHTLGYTGRYEEYDGKIYWNGKDPGEILDANYEWINNVKWKCGNLTNTIVCVYEINVTVDSAIDSYSMYLLASKIGQLDTPKMYWDGYNDRKRMTFKISRGERDPNYLTIDFPNKQFIYSKY